MTTDTSRSLLLDVDTPVAMPGLALRRLRRRRAAYRCDPETPDPRVTAAPLARRHRMLLRAADALALSAAACSGAVGLELLEPLRAGDFGCARW